jgi:phospholipid-binding lipoprotein MlaA
MILTLTRWLALAAATLSLWGCATTAQPDPLEPWNRKVFAFNEAVDEAVLAPTARVYQDVVPSPVRTGVTNFFTNISDAWSAINSFLQFKGADGLRTTLRVGINTFFGLGGLIDIASDAGLEPGREDFGQTLGHWGVGAGAYIVWPLLGPSTLRDSAALPLDLQASHRAVIHDQGLNNSLTVLGVVNTRARLLGATRVLEDAALDKYLFTRDAWLQRRRSLVYDGNPPDEPEDDWDEEDAGDEPSGAAPSPAVPASAAP